VRERRGGNLKAQDQQLFVPRDKIGFAVISGPWERLCGGRQALKHIQIQSLDSASTTLYVEGA